MTVRCAPSRTNPAVEAGLPEPQPCNSWARVGRSQTDGSFGLIHPLSGQLASRGGSIAAHGRTGECAAVDDVLDQARSGHAKALVLHGESGIGKTAVIDRAIARADGFKVVRVRAIESEQELTDVGLQLLASALKDGLARLQPAHLQALDTALERNPGRGPDAGGMAVLSLLREASDSPPLLCILDDAQWLDRGSA